MQNIVDWLFEARHLKNVQRTGYQFLGAGRESVAEHAYSTTMIAMAMSQLVPAADALKLMQMCLLHDLPEARMGDLNYVQKQYVVADESKALADSTRDLSFGAMAVDLVVEFNTGTSLEARLANDADQLALLLELKELHDLGFEPPKSWMPAVKKRIHTEIGRKLAQGVLAAKRDRWWRKDYVAPKHPTSPESETKN